MTPFKQCIYRGFFKTFLLFYLFACSFFYYKKNWKVTKKMTGCKSLAFYKSICRIKVYCASQVSKEIDMPLCDLCMLMYACCVACLIQSIKSIIRWIKLEKKSKILREIGKGWSGQSICKEFGMKDFSIMSLVLYMYKKI